MSRAGSLNQTYATVWATCDSILKVAHHREIFKGINNWADAKPAHHEVEKADPNEQTSARFNNSLQKHDYNSDFKFLK